MFCLNQQQTQQIWYIMTLRTGGSQAIASPNSDEEEKRNYIEPIPNHTDIWVLYTSTFSNAPVNLAFLIQKGYIPFSKAVISFYLIIERTL